MKRTAALLLALILTLTLCACGKEPVKAATTKPSETAGTAKPAETAKPEETGKPDETAKPEPEIEKTVSQNPELYVSVNSEYRYGEDNVTLFCSSTYPTVTLVERGEGSYPKLAAAIGERNAEAADNAAQTLSEMTSMAKEAYGYSPETVNSFFNDVYLSIVRADGTVLSMVETVVNYSGGAHPNRYYGGVNYDAQTGEELELSDVVTDTDKFADIVAETIMVKYPNTEFFNLRESVKQTIANGYLSWTLGYGEIVVYFSPYEIASYADGLLTAEIRLKDFDGLVRDKYLSVPESYATELSEYGVLYADLNGDGDDEELSITPSYDSNHEYIGSFEISCGGKAFTAKDMHLFSISCLLVRMDGERSYVYIDGVAENDWHTIYVYSVGADGVKPVTELSGTGFDCSESLGRSTLTNPSSFMLATRMQLLGTYQATKLYSVGADGAPVSEDEIYLTDVSYVLTAKRDIAAFELTAAGTYRDAVISEGSELSIVGTDGESAVYLRDTGDGLIYHVDIQTNGVQSIDGVSIYDCFDGIFFAG